MPQPGKHRLRPAAAMQGPAGPHLELEEAGELLLDLAGVRAAAPVPGQVVRVRRDLQQRQLGLKGRALLRNEGSRHGQHNAQRRAPPVHCSWLCQSRFMPCWGRMVGNRDPGEGSAGGGGNGWSSQLSQATS